MAPTGISYTKCAFRGNFSEARRQLICARLRVHVGTQEFTRTTFTRMRALRERKLRGGGGGKLILEVSPIFSSREHNRLTAPLLECSSALMIFRISREEDCAGMRLQIYRDNTRSVLVWRTSF